MSLSESSAPSRNTCPPSMLDALRSSGDHLADPVRFRLIEAMARRSESHDGAVRRVLDARLAELLSDYRELLERAQPSTVTPALPVERGALADLVTEMAARAQVHELDIPKVVEALSYFRFTWSKLSAARQLVQSRESVPANAGPLNSNVLVHQSLRLMQDVSPEYLHRFISYVEELRWLGQLGMVGDSSPKPDPTRTVRRGNAKVRAG